MSNAPLEAAYVKKHQRLIDKAGGWSMKTQGNIYRGISDRICCINGIFVAIEVKRDRLYATPVTAHQQVYIDKIRQAGGVAYVAYGAQGVEWTEYVIETLDEHGKDMVLTPTDGIRLHVPIDQPNVRVYQ